jgi:type II secretory pathway pseudopilin PulG
MVVVAIIAILIAIFMPSAGRAREQARRVSCESHLRGIGGAATAFASEHGRVFPMAYQMPQRTLSRSIGRACSTRMDMLKAWAAIVTRAR